MECRVEQTLLDTMETRVVLVEIICFTEGGSWHLNGHSSRRKIIVNESALCDSVKMQGQEKCESQTDASTSEYF